MDIDKKVWEVLCSEEQLKTRITELGEQLSKDYEGKKLMVVSLLKGSFIFCADLVRALSVPVRIEFMTTSSYGHGTASSGRVQIVNDIKSDLEGYDVLVVDDITDSAHTMASCNGALKS